MSLDNHYNQEIQDIKNRIWSALIDEKVREVRPRLSNRLFEACGTGELEPLIQDLYTNPDRYLQHYHFEEYDINMVGYRLMGNGRFAEAEMVLRFNLHRYPQSWNVYDSLGELMLKTGNDARAKDLYERSLELNPENDSAVRALEQMK